MNYVFKLSLGYFFNANNLTQTRLQIQSPDLRLEAVFMVLHIKFANANLERS